MSYVIEPHEHEKALDTISDQELEIVELERELAHYKTLYHEADLQAERYEEQLYELQGELGEKERELESLLPLRNAVEEAICLLGHSPRDFYSPNQAVQKLLDALNGNA